MCPLFKIPVAVHRILLILDVSGAHPIALLSLFYRSSLINRSSIAQLGPSWLSFLLLFLSISLGSSSIAHLSLIYRSAVALLLVLRISADPLDGAAGWFFCTSSLPCRLSEVRHCHLHSSQLAFASAGRCAAALLGQRTVIKIVEFWVQVVLLTFDSVSFGTRQTLSKSPRRWNTIDWLPVCDQFVGLIAGNRLAVHGLESHSQRFNFKKKKEKRKVLPKFGDGNVVNHMFL
jgi:hypothetical protein